MKKLTTGERLERQRAAARRRFFGILPGTRAHTDKKKQAKVLLCRAKTKNSE